MYWKEVTFLFMVISNAVTMMKIRNIATLNVRGKDDDKFTLVEDAKKYEIDILTLPEHTHPRRPMPSRNSIREELIRFILLQ